MMHGSESASRGATLINTLWKFLGTTRFEAVPPPRWDTLGFWGDTVVRWHHEGLAEGVHPTTHFGQEGAYRIPVHSGFVDMPYYPVFEHEVLRDDGEFVIYRDPSGIVKRERKSGADRSMPQFLEFPVKDRRGWETLLCRLNPDSPERYPDWDDTRRAHSEREIPWFATICGGYGTPRNLFGEEHLAYAYYDQPDLIHDIMRHWVAFHSRMFEIILSHIGLDYIYIWEDIAFKNGPLISPALFAEFMLPYYKELIGRLRELGVPTIMVDSDGDNRALLDLFIESGVDFFMPFEIAAGMDPAPIREKYGEKLIIWGGIDKRELSRDLDAVEREVMSKVPKLMKTRGYIPAVDHLVPPDVPFANYSRFVELIRDVCEG